MITRVVVLVFVGTAFAASTPIEAADPPSARLPRVAWKPLDGKTQIACVEVAGLPSASLAWLEKPERTVADWNAALGVRVVERGAVAPLCLLGKYAVAGAVVRFTPRFPLEPGLTYRATLDMKSLGTRQGSTPDDPIVADFILQRPPQGPQARVTAIYPSCDLLPENLLRLYIHFSAPMSRGEAYRRIHLRDDQGREIDAPFLELDEELWSADQTRFTLLFDPGRIKRGLKPREEVGPALKAGGSYTIVVDAAWQDARGRSLAAGASKAFRVGPADQTSPDPANWKVETLRAGGVDPLVVVFPEPIDHALLERMLSVLDHAGARLDGTVSVDKGERVWRWRPRQPWREGDHRIAIDVELEDLAGNSVARPFEVDETRPITTQTTIKTRDLPFRVGPSGR